jgi:hypothetical protein
MTAKAAIDVAVPPTGAPPRLTCAGCDTTRDRPATQRGEWRTPAGWKRLQDRFWCPACKRQQFMLRAIALPISGPVDATWPELRDALHTAFAETTRCANWLVTQFYARDRRREPGDTRLAAMPRVYLYPEARTLFPSLASQTLASLEQQVLARYRATRLALVWRHAVSLPTYRYPMPLPLPARMWTLEQQDERWRLSVRIGDRRWQLRLRQGPGMGRQIRVLQQVADGALDAGEATLYEIAAHDGDHRSTSAPDRRLMVKLAVWLARPTTTTAALDGADFGGTAIEGATVDAASTRTAGVLIVRTTSSAFLTAQPVGSDSPTIDTWTLDGERVRRWIADAERRRQRVHDELLRRPPHEAVSLANVMHAERQRAARLRRRLHDWTHQVTARLIAGASRRRVTTIVWDDGIRDYLPTYPWQRFVTTLTDKAAAAGIRVIAAEPATARTEHRKAGHLQASAPSKVRHAGRPGPLRGTRTSAGDNGAPPHAPPGRSRDLNCADSVDDADSAKSERSR